MKKIQYLFLKYQTFIYYALFGIPSTIISFGGYLLLIDFFHIKAFAASGISWIVALMISFFLYRRFVFHSTAHRISKIAEEFIKFTAMRILSGFMETGFVWLFVDFFKLNPLLFKVAASFLAALLNYTVSRLYIFHHKKT